MLAPLYHLLQIRRSNGMKFMTPGEAETKLVEDAPITLVFDQESQKKVFGLGSFRSQSTRFGANPKYHPACSENLLNHHAGRAFVTLADSAKAWLRRA